MQSKAAKMDVFQCVELLVSYQLKKDVSGEPGIGKSSMELFGNLQIQLSSDVLQSQFFLRLVIDEASGKAESVDESHRGDADVEPIAPLGDEAKIEGNVVADDDESVDTSTQCSQNGGFIDLVAHFAMYTHAAFVERCDLGDSLTALGMKSRRLEVEIDQRSIVDTPVGSPFRRGSTSELSANKHWKSLAVLCGDHTYFVRWLSSTLRLPPPTEGFGKL